MLGYLFVSHSASMEIQACYGWHSEAQEMVELEFRPRAMASQSVYSLIPDSLLTTSTLERPQEVLLGSEG